MSLSSMALVLENLTIYMYMQLFHIQTLNNSEW